MHSQADVDTFVANCSAVTSVNYLEIGTYSAFSDITDISGLSNLTSAVLWTTIVNNPQLVSLEGLENFTNSGLYGMTILNNATLTNLSGLEGTKNTTVLSIQNNANLESLSGLDSLESIGKGFSIINNGNLTSLSALQSLETIGGEFAVFANHLASFDGLQNLTSIGTQNWNGSPAQMLIAEDHIHDLQGLNGLQYIKGGIALIGNDSLQTLDGLDNLDSNLYFIQLTDNYLLEDISALANIDTVFTHNSGAGSAYAYGPYPEVWIRFSKLTNLNGLQGLKKVYGSVAIQFNSFLTDISALENLEFVGEDYVIEYNNQLPLCHISSVCNHLSMNGGSHINFNAPGCSDVFQVADSCNLSTWFRDLDGDDFGDTNAYLFSSTQPSGYASSSGDCNDNNPNINPGATEICNAFDDDCDGLFNEEPLNITLGFSQGKPLCTGDQNGWVRVNPPGLPTNWTYSWGNGATSRTISNLPAGSYSVTVTRNSDLCIAVGTQNLTDPPPLAVDISTVHNKCFGQTQGKVSALASGGTGTKTYSWSTGSTSSQINNLPGGDYSLTVTDNKGCTLTDMSTVNTPPEFFLNYEVTTLSNGKFKVTLAGSGGTPYTSAVPYRYCRVSATGSCAYTTTSIYSNLVAGTYTFSGRDKNGCSISHEVVLPPTQAPASSDNRDGNSGEGISQSGFMISPNPIDNQCVIAILGETQNQDFRAEVYDLSGRQIAASVWPAGQPKISLDSGEWPTGVLFLKIVRPADNVVMGRLRAVKAGSN